MTEPLDSSIPILKAPSTYPVLRASRWALRAGAIVWVLHEVAVLFFLDGNPDDGLTFALAHYIGAAAVLGRLFNVLLRAFVLFALAEAIQLGLEVRQRLAQ